VGPGADLIPNLAFRVPLLLLCELLGAPAGERDLFVGPAHDIVTGRLSAEQSAIAFDVVKSYFKSLVDRKRTNPGSDLISDLLLDTEVNAVWTEEELYGVGSVLLLAGHDSTSVFVSNLLYWLVHNPAVYVRLRREPENIPRAVEEFLRFLPVGVPGARTRVTLEDVQVGDTLVCRDASVLAVTHAANLDPRVFPCPRDFDMDREMPASHLAFGFGSRFCPGAQLARMDTTAIVRGLVSRFESLEPVDADPDWLQKSTTRGPKSLCVRW
jgi:nocardicin N-oxygenase